MSKLNSILYEKIYFNEIISDNLKNKSRLQQFESLLLIKSDDERLKDILNYLNTNLKNLSAEEFDDISSKYLNKLNEVNKDLMSKLKVSKEENILNILLSNIEALNKNFANFFNHVHKNFQNFNDKQKNLTKLIPNVLKIHFKLFEENFTENNLNKDFQIYQYIPLFKSFFLNVMVLINNFPTMMRTFESKLNNILKFVLSEIVTQNLINETKFVNIICLTYSMLIRLSPDVTTKFNLFLNRLIENIKYYKSLFEPKSIKTVKSKVKKELETKDNIFNFKQNFIAKLKNPSILLSNNIIFLLLKIVKFLFKCIPKNSLIEINFNNFINLIIENLESVTNNSELISINESDFIVEGLNLEDYKIFREFYVIRNFKIFRFLIKNYSEYLYYYIPQIKNFVSKLILNLDKTYLKYYENYLEVFKFFETLIKYFDSRLYFTNQEFVIKILINNFVDIYVSFLERNDKSVVRTDNSYFKLAKVKTNLKKKGITQVSLLQMARQENFNEKLENYSNSEIEEILILYLRVFVTFFKSDCLKIVNLNQENKNLLKSLIDTVLLPPYAKFIFGISHKAKELIGEFIFSYLENNLNNFEKEDEFEHWDKLIQFVKSFYSNNDLMSFKIFSIYDKLRKRKHIFGKETITDITSNFVDLNKKIGDKIKSRGQNVLNIIENNLDQNEKLQNENLDNSTNSNIQENKNSKLEEDSKKFKIEYSINLEDDDKEQIENNKIEKKSKNVNFDQSKKIKEENEKDNEYFEFMTTKKKMKIENENTPMTSKSETNESVNKIFKSKWKQVNPQSNEFESKDGIYLKIKNKEEFMIVEDKKEKVNTKMIVEDEEDQDIDSESEIEIPDIF